MKRSFYLIFFLLIGVISCTEEVDQKDIPFEMQPEGLKRGIEIELIENMKKEVEESHQIMNDFYSSKIFSFCLEIELRNFLAIKRNFKEDILINHQLKPINSIQEKVQEFYLTNESLNSDKTRKLIGDDSYQGYHYPFYSNISRTAIIDEIKRNQTYLEEATQEGEEGYISFYEKALEQWKEKLKVITFLGSEELKEIHPQAHIEIRDELNTEGFSPLTIEAMKGLIEVRNFASKKYFGVSYMHIYFQATHYYDKQAANQLAAINHLYPVRIVDRSFARSKGYRTSWWDEIEPPTLETTP